VTVRAAARSISRPVRQHLRRKPPPALEVLAVFERACDLVSSDDQGRRPVIALVTPEIGDGPLNVVLDGTGWSRATIEAGTPSRTDGERLRVGGLVVDLGQAEVWEPRPDWAALRRRHAAIGARMPALCAVSLEHAREGSFLALLDEVSSENPSQEAVLAAARSAANALQIGWAGDLARLREGAARLAGLGGGLTPAGDDFLCGAMLWAWLAHPEPRSFCGAIVETAAPRTTTLSAAFLQAAAQGECSAAWHALLNALAQGDDSGVSRAAPDVLAHGATSGADALAGFLWAGTRIGLG
jgi:hypothetical protein